jgi:hypothetical protein
MNHIKYEDGVARCGAALDMNFHFKDIEQVIINNFHGERLVCQYCLRTVITSLLVVPPGIQWTLSDGTSTM